MIAMGMLNDQLMVKWTGASGPVAVKTAMIGLKLAVIKAPVMPKKKQAVVNHMIPKGSAVHGMMPPTVAVSSRSVICMLALKATASSTDPTIERVSLRHRSEEHTSELQSLTNLVCRLLLEKKKKNKNYS